MTIAEASLRPVDELTTSIVESLVEQLRDERDARVPSAHYQACVDEYLEADAARRSELAPMLDVALASKRLRPTAELVWTGPSTPVAPVPKTEQVLSSWLGMPNGGSP